MSKDIDERVGFNTLTSQLEEVGTTEAVNLAEDIRHKEKRALRLVSGEADAEKERSIAGKRQFVIGLAFVDGDMQKGLKESIGFAKGDLDKMDELKMSFSYSGDVQVGIPFNSPYIPFILPNGQTGTLIISIDQEKGEFIYELRKDIRRSDDERKVSGIA